MFASPNKNIPQYSLVNEVKESFFVFFILLQRYLNFEQ